MTKYFLRDTPLEEYERLMMAPPHPMRQTRVTVTLEPLPQAAQFYDCHGCLAFQRKRCTARHCAWIKERLENQYIGYRILVLQQIRTLRFNELTKRVQNLHIPKATIQYKHLYAYERGEDGTPRIIPEQAEVVRRIYDSFLAGYSMRMIKESLERDGIQTVKGNSDWSISAIRNILKNEKYCGDVLQQKTYTSDCISRKQIRNTGQLPMYLVQNHHEGIVSRDTYNAV